MSKATEGKLSKLHGKVAQVLMEQLEDTISIVDESGEEREIPSASPATLAQAIKFLKDNEVTATIEEDENLNGLADMLKEKREKRGLRLVAGESE
jgi:hypothetical protein